MAYRGEDLDLRTPQTWGAMPSDAPAASDLRVRATYSTQHRGPIWVDDVVLACCNHAYDVALAHRAVEVRLEHLLHAMTRLDIAAEALEARGVRVQQLRRESATVIAGEMPTSAPNGKSQPRRSEEIEEVLRLAAAQAQRRTAPASIDDIVNVLMELSPDTPGVQLFQRQLMSRHASSYPEATPAMMRNPYAYDPLEANRLRGYGAPTDPLRGQAPLSPSPTDNLQNSRLDVLEQMVRTLSSDLQSDRKSFGMLMQDIQREIAGQRDEASRLSGGLSDRLQSALGDRIQSLEHAVHSSHPSSSPDLAPMFERIAALERAVQQGQAEQARGQQSINDRLVQLSSRTAAVDMSQVASRLDIIEEAVLSRDDARERELSQRLEQLAGDLAAERQKQSDIQAAVAEQLQGLAAAIEKQRSEIAVAIITPLKDRIDALMGEIESRNQEGVESLESIVTGVAGLEQQIGHLTTSSSEAQAAYAHDLAEVHDALMKLNANQHTLAGTVEQWRRDGSTALAGLGERLQDIGGLVGGIGSRVDGLGTGLEGLSRRVEQIGPPLDGLGLGLTSLGERISGLERESARPVAMLETMSATMDNMHRVTVERYYRRNRFWYWLFGTDDWVAASWPSHSARISDDLKAVKVQREA